MFHSFNILQNLTLYIQEQQPKCIENTHLKEKYIKCTIRLVI